MRTPIEISWDEMEDSIDTAQAFLTAFILEDSELQSEIARNFIFPAIESGDADKLIYGFATVAATVIIATAKIDDLDPLDLIAEFNQIRMDSPLESEDQSE